MGSENEISPCCLPMVRTNADAHLVAADAEGENSSALQPAAEMECLHASHDNDSDSDESDCDQLSMRSCFADGHLQSGQAAQSRARRVQVLKYLSEHYESL